MNEFEKYLNDFGEVLNKNDFEAFLDFIRSYPLTKGDPEFKAILNSSHEIQVLTFYKVMANHPKVKDELKLYAEKKLHELGSSGKIV